MPQIDALGRATATVQVDVARPCLRPLETPACGDQQVRQRLLVESLGVQARSFAHGVVGVDDVALGGNLVRPQRFGGHRHFFVVVLGRPHGDSRQQAQDKQGRGGLTVAASTLFDHRNVRRGQAVFARAGENVGLVPPPRTQRRIHGAGPRPVGSRGDFAGFRRDHDLVFVVADAQALDAVEIGFLRAVDPVQDSPHRRGRPRCRRRSRRTCPIHLGPACANAARALVVDPVRRHRLKASSRSAAPRTCWNRRRSRGMSTRHERPHRRPDRFGSPPICRPATPAKGI